MARRILEVFKSLLIVVLILNILLLSLLALPNTVLQRLPLPEFLKEFSGISPHENVLSAETGTLSAVTKPYFVSVKHEDGRATVRLDSMALSLAHDKFSRFFSLALSTAMEERSISDWSFLERPGVLFAYSGNIPAQALSQWLGKTDGKVGGTCSHFALVCENGGVFLYTVMDSVISRYATSVHAGELMAQMAEYPADGTELAYDVKEGRAHPLTLMEGSLSIAEYTAVSPVTQSLADELAVLLDFNAYGAGTYTDPNGNRVYTEGQRSLTISPNGMTLNLPAEESRFSAAGDGDSDFVAAAAGLLEQLRQTAGVNAELYLCDFAQADGVTTLSFRYVLGGIPVYPACASLTYTGRNLITLSLIRRE